ncbi:MAG: hypothetical protein J5525_04960 [Lachnospiraceae bacterium]|nr:hypothetical protein [Lachnospiraceae bacterium]
MAKEMIWVAKGGRPCKNKPKMSELRKEAKVMTVQELMEKYDVSQATMYRYLKEAFEGPVKKEKAPAPEDLNMKELIKENADLKKQVERLMVYKQKYEDLKKKVK